MEHQNGLLFIGFFFAGLAVNLTPCVYPMLTVTASLFKSRQSQNETLKSSFPKALTYFFGIAVMYSALGYFAAATGKILGSVLQNTWVLLGVSVIMFVLALSMFGLFQLSIPAQLLNLLGGLGVRPAKQAIGNIYLGLFISGMLVGVFAAPCIGPPVIALLAAVAANGNPLFGLSAFFVFSLGLGLPYLLLGTFSGSLAKLPKAGYWLIWVERIFGVILLGFSFFYLSLALRLDLVHRVWPVTTSANLPGEQSKAVWQPYSDKKVAAAISQNKPVVIDFYADWCISCHELDHFVLSAPQVAARLSQLTTLRVDATNMDNPQVQALIDRYGLIGLPTVIFLDTKGQEIKQARVEGVVSIKEFLESLDIVAKAGHITYKS